MALLGLILGGCSKELARGGKGEVPGLPEKGQAVTFTVTTGVETYAVPAQDYEKSISTLQALLFDASGRYVTSGTPAPTAPGSISYTLPIATTGTYKMLLVANYTIPAGSLTGKSLSDVRAILVENEPGMPNAFVMASTNIPDFTVNAGAMTPAGTINLERLTARIDVQSTLDKLTLSKITVKNRKTQSSLLAASSTNAYRTDAKEYGSFERFRKPATDASMGQIYAYENSAASASSADGTSLLIETAYNGYAVKPLEVKLPQMKRNYIYSIQLMMGDEGYVPDPSDNPDPSKIKLTYNVRVVDWNNGQTFTVSEEDLLKIFKKGAVSYAYNVQVTTTPDISSSVSADGGTVTINATATKQKLVGGTPDPTTPAETITGGDKFSYTVTNGPVDWISISPTGIVTVSPNTTSAIRVATIAVSPKENPSASGSINITQLGKPVTPTTTHVYALTSVSPDALRFDAAGGSGTLSIVGADIELRDGVQIKTTPLKIADVTITKGAGAGWLTVAVDGTVTAAKNVTTAARRATLTIAVTADPSQVKTLVVSQAAGTGVDTSALKYNPLAYVAKYNVGVYGWDTNHTIPSSKTYEYVLEDWDSAMSSYEKPRSISGSKETYKLPSLEEWNGIIDAYPTIVFRGNGDVLHDQISQVEVAGRMFDATSDYKSTTIAFSGSRMKCTVALRFNGGRPLENQYRSAWLYCWGAKNVNGKSVNGLWIYCVNIAARQSISTVDQLDQKFWDQSRSSSVVRFFPASGIVYDGTYADSGTEGHYWIARSFLKDKAYSVSFDDRSIDINSAAVGRTSRCAVRLFSTSPLD